MSEPSRADRLDEERALKKASRRLIWFLFILLVINFIDRINVGFAALQMNRELHISATLFGLSLTAFSVGYLVCEIPSNILMERFGARIWLARIMVTWGLASAACALTTGAASLIGLRTLVGVAEAGFTPGVVLYLTYWYPQFHRARAQAKFFIAQPIAAAFGAVLSGQLLGLNGALGLAGWRWLFLIEGFPAVVFGIIAFFYLTDKPADARWLTPRERSAIETAVRREAEERERASGALPGAKWSLLFSKNMLLISIAYATLIGNYSAAGYWLPQIVRAASAPGQPYWMTGLLAAIPPLASAAFLPFWSMRSDRSKERYWHSIGPMVAAGLGWFMAAELSSPVWRLVGLTIAGVFSIAVWSPFFTMPSAVLPRRAHAVGIAFLNTIGMCGAALTPLEMGRLRDQTGGFAAPMIFVGATLIFGAVLMLFVPRALLNGSGATRKSDVESTAITPI